MGGQTRRKPVTTFYEPCKTCPQNISRFGVCKAGYENFHSRRTKINHCPKCDPSFLAAQSFKENSDKADGGVLL